MKDLSIYIHIPFCKQKCSYCSFVSFAGCECFFSEYFCALKKEILENCNAYNGYDVKTIFIGGGTPSVVNSKNIVEIIQLIKANFNVCDKAEISIEANPDSATNEKLEDYFNCGINRISFGVQSLNDDILKLINRPHLSLQAINAIKMAQKVGFKNINADVMLALPNQKLEDVKNTIQQLLETNIVHISIYSLILEENTPIFKQYVRSPHLFPSEDEAVEMFETAREMLENAGFERYEVANFAKKGYECKHNLTYWNLSDYVGFGLNSHSKIGNTRFYNTSNLQDYLSGKFLKSKETLTCEEMLEEEIMLKLRTTKGIEKSHIKKESELNELIKNGFLAEKNGYIYATNKGFMVLNQIILKLV